MCVCVFVCLGDALRHFHDPFFFTMYYVQDVWSRGQKESKEMKK